jgi:hypothetical protein
MGSELKNYILKWSILEISGEEASIYKDFHLLHDTGVMYIKVTFFFMKSEKNVVKSCITCNE